MIDSHAHLSYENGKASIGKILEKFKSNGGQYVIDIATGLKELHDCLEVQKEYGDIVKLSYAIHPERNHQTEEDLKIHIVSLIKELHAMEELVASHKVTPVTIGETGYDIYRTELPTDPLLEIERELFIAHIELGKKLNLPVMIHARGKETTDYSMHYKSVETIKEKSVQIPYYFHSFAGDVKLLNAILDVDGYVGINGVISYQNVADLRESVKSIPLDKMLLETDAPFLVPSNMDRNLLEDKSKNEPSAVMFTAKIIGKLLNVAPEQIIEVTTENAKRLYRL